MQHATTKSICAVSRGYTDRPGGERKTKPVRLEVMLKLLAGNAVAEKLACVVAFDAVRLYGFDARVGCEKLARVRHFADDVVLRAKLVGRRCDRRVYLRRDGEEKIRRLHDLRRLLRRAGRRASCEKRHEETRWRTVDN